MAPDPVPRSATSGRSGQPGQLGQGDLDDDFGLGPGYEHPAVDHQVELAKGPVAEDVLDGLARFAPAPACA